MSGILQLFATGSGYSAQALALFARMSTPPTEARKVLINNAIVALVNAGVWAKLDALYVTAAADSQAAGLNWLSTSYNLTVNGAPSFTADRGYTGVNGSATVYLDTSFNPSTAGGLYTQNSSHLSVWSRSSGQFGTAGGAPIGASSATTGSVILPRYTDDNLYGRVNGAVGGSVTNTNGTGLYTASRTGAAAGAIYKNGASVTTFSDTSGAPYNANILVLAFNRNIGIIGVAIQVAAATIGSGLTTQNALDLYNAMQTYMTAVGA